MNKYIVGIATLMIMVGLSTQASAAVTADILFLVDESGSMGGGHTWLHDMIGTLDSNLISEGVTNNLYGLVGFGSYAHDPSGGALADAHSHTFGGTGWSCWNNGSSLWGTAADFAIGTTPIPDPRPNPLLWIEDNGDYEDGWHAIDFALTNYTFRSDAALNIVLVTDEGRDSRVATHYNLEYSDILDALDVENAMLNVVVDIDLWDTSPVSPLPDLVALGVDSDFNAFVADGIGGYTAPPGNGGTASGGHTTTLTDYVDLAWDTGGAAWDLTQLQAGGDIAASFTAAFVDIKVGEIQFQDPNPNPPVPEPGSIVIWSLLGLVFGGASLRRRRRRA